MADQDEKARSRCRGKVTRLTNELREYRTSQNVDQDDLAYKIHVLSGRLEELRQIQTALDKVGMPDESTHADLASEELFKASRLLSRLESASAAPRAVPIRTFDDQQFELKSSLVVKLPTFDGDVMNWVEFWELYNVSVHHNPRYAAVQKFVLLKSHLGSAPKQAIEGIPVSEEGYHVALDVLTKRYARDDVRRDRLLHQLLELPAVSDPHDLKALHRFVDTLTARVRGLESLGVSSDSFCSLLLPVLKEKLPEAWRLEWARQPAEDFRAFLDFLQQEMLVRERAACSTRSAAGVVARTSTGCSAVSGLLAHREVGETVARRQRPVDQPRGRGDCVACGAARHGLAACAVYRNSDAGARWEMVRAAGLCFRCLGPHYARDCHSSDCLSCGGPHHTSLHSVGEPQHQPGAAARDRRPPAQRSDSRHQPPPSYREGRARPALQPPSPGGQLPQRPGLSPAPRQTMNVAAASAVDPLHSAVQPPAVLPPVTPQPAVSCAAATVNTACALADKLVTSSATVDCLPCDPSCLDSTKSGLPAACDSVCYMQTALVEATGPRGTCQLRVLLDGGSDSSYVRASAAELLGLPTVGRGVFACLGFQERQEEPRLYEKVRLSLRSRHGGESQVFDLWKSDRLCSQLTPARPPATVYTPHLLLADDFEGGPVDVLIGADLMYRVVLWEQVRLTDHLRAVETVFGYVLHGRDEAPVSSTQKYALRCSRLLSQDFQPEELWSLEAIGISAGDQEERPSVKPKWSDAEKRYEMRLLWKNDDRPVSNFSSTAARTRRMEGRLTVQERDEYHRHLRELQRSGVVEETSAGDDGFYLPHRGIWRKGKLRVVYDGSARDATGRSLNDYLDASENLLRRLPAVLLNFRRDLVAAQADIRAAFHQVSVVEEDRKFLQFVWASQRLRFRRVPFGLTCSPYMLLQTLTTHLGQYCITDPLLCKKVEAGLYMDDVCTSFSSRSEAESGMKRMEEIFSDAGMELYKLRISGDDIGVAAPVLGLRWCTSSDRLAVSVPSLPSDGSR